jgi:hypothetical protein
VSAALPAVPGLRFAPPGMTSFGGYPYRLMLSSSSSIWSAVVMIFEQAE